MDSPFHEFIFNDSFEQFKLKVTEENKNDVIGCFIFTDYEKSQKCIDFLLENFVVDFNVKKYKYQDTYFHILLRLINRTDNEILITSYKKWLKFLVDNYADYTIKNNEGYTPFHYDKFNYLKILIEERDSLEIKEPSED